MAIVRPSEIVMKIKLALDRKKVHTPVLEVDIVADFTDLIFRLN